MVTALFAVALVVRIQGDAGSDSAIVARNQVASAGANGAAALLSYDYRSVNDVVATNQRLLTTTCAAGYAAQIDGGVKAQVIANKVVVATQVRAAAVQSIDADGAVVLVVVDEKRTGTDLAAPQSSQLAVSVGLVRDGGRWLVSDVVPAGTTSETAGGSAAAHPCS